MSSSGIIHHSLIWERLSQFRDAEVIESALPKDVLTLVSSTIRGFHSFTTNIYIYGMYVARNKVGSKSFVSRRYKFTYPLLF